MKGNRFSPAQLRAMKAAGIDTKTLKEGIDPKGAARMDAAKGKKAETQDQKDKRLMLGKHSPAVKYAKMKKEEVEEVQMTERERVLESLKSRTQSAVDHQRQGTHGDDHEMDNMKKDTEKSVKRMNDRMGADAAGKRSEADVRRRFPKKEEVEYVEEERARVTQNGNIYIVGFTWLGKYMIIKLFFPEVKRPSRKQAQIALDKIYPGAKIQRFDQAPYNPSEPMLYMGVQEEVEQLQEKEVDVKDTRRTVDAIRAYDKSKDASRDATADSDEGKKGKAKKERAYAKKERGEIDKDDPNWKKRKYHTGMHGESVEDEKKNLTEKSAAWQRKEGKNKKGGLNEKGRKSYERENPGSDLKAPQPEGGPRKRSFCARMGGVKGPMKKPNGEPTRKALALRKWKC